MIIPFEQLSREALFGLVEEFITREGTDYGAYEVELTDKVDQIIAQLRVGAVCIVFDAGTETTTIMTKEQYGQWTVDKESQA